MLEIIAEAPVLEELTIQHCPELKKHFLTTFSQKNTGDTPIHVRPV